MGSKVLPLPRPLVSLPTGPPTYSRRQGLSAFSSPSPPSSPHRLAISRVPPRGFGTAVLSQVVRRRRLSMVVGTSSGSDEVEAVGDSVGAALEVEEALDNDGVGDEPEASDPEAEEKPPRKPRIKLGDIMGILNKRAVEASEKERPVPDIRTGDVVVIKLEVPENRRRLSVYKGIVMSKQNAGIHTTIRIRRIIAGVGVEIVFPLYSPNIKEIKVVSHRKVRRARLYYLRDKLPRLSTFK